MWLKLEPERGCISGAPLATGIRYQRTAMSIPPLRSAPPIQTGTRYIVMSL
jgi:hypothetical protein